jgi:protein associated with RNAse G/E
MSHADLAFDVGSTAVRRDTFRGKVWSAAPFRVVRDDGDLLAMALWPGVQKVASTTWIEWLRTGDETTRNRALPNLAAGRWELDTWTWESTTKLTLLQPGAYFSVDLYFRDCGELVMWYVNFERPFQRTRIGVDTFDLLLDLVVEPDMSFRWKDEGEYTQARQLGIVSDDEHRQVHRAREHVLALLDERTGPFEERWGTWRRNAHWPLPTLPPNATTLPVPPDQVR